MKSWVRQVRALTATMVELRMDRARWERRCWELRAGIPEGGAALLQLSGYSRDEVLGMHPVGSPPAMSPELTEARAELDRIDETLASLERKVREIVESADGEAQAKLASGRAKASPIPANVVPFRRPVPAPVAALALVEVA